MSYDHFYTEPFSFCLSKNNCIEYGADWSHLTKIAVSVAKTAKYSQSLLGAYVHDQQIQEKVRKPRKVQTKSQLVRLFIDSHKPK